MIVPIPIIITLFMIAVSIIIIIVALIMVIPGSGLRILPVNGRSIIGFEVHDVSIILLIESHTEPATRASRSRTWAWVWVSPSTRSRVARLGLGSSPLWSVRARTRSSPSPREWLPLSPTLRLSRPVSFSRRTRFEVGITELVLEPPSLVVTSWLLGRPITMPQEVVHKKPVRSDV
jgi:hypothetical protein